MDGCLYYGKQWFNTQDNKHSADNIDSNNGFHQNNYNNDGQNKSKSDNKDDKIVGAFEGCPWDSTLFACRYSEYGALGSAHRLFSLLGMQLLDHQALLDVS